VVKGRRRLVVLTRPLACAIAVTAAWWSIAPRGAAARAMPIVVTLRPERAFQTIHSFGASDAWSVQFLGRNWPAAERERAADLLFSTGERADGSSIGIGLSAYRFEIGAGSATLGDSSRINDRWRRAEGFLRPNGHVDWDAQRGQRAFMKDARARGVNTFIGFTNSPPVALTRNGRATSSGGDSANLAPERYADFARFLTSVVVELDKRDGIRLDYLSPFNEPQWDWTSGQEGSPWRVDEMAAMTRTLSRTLTEAKLSTRISIGESGRMNYVYEAADKPTRGRQVQSWFRRGSPHYVGDLGNLVHAIAAHSYHSTNPRDTLRAVRARLRDSVAAVDPTLEIWQSEYCVLETTPLIRGRGRDPSINAALYIAGIVHTDLVVANASAWHWWLAVTPYDYKDGLLYMDRDSLGGTIRDSKMLWGLGHFSRFVRPGMRRIEAEVAGVGVDDVDAELFVSSYRDPASGRVVVVLVNRGGDREVVIRGAGASAWRVYRTTSAPDVNLKASGVVRAGESLAIPARSFATLVSS
jgi:O-glycosyl hydrolase